MSTPTPKTRFAKNGDLHIAYQVVGEGDFDLVYAPGWVSHVEESDARGARGGGARGERRGLRARVAGAWPRIPA